MRAKTNLQIPISAAIKAQAEEIAEKQGFSSLQEVLRVFIANYVSGNVSISFGTTATPEKLAMYQIDLEKTAEEVASGKAAVHESPEDALAYLASL